MQNETINPIRHSTLGTVSGTAFGAAGGGLKTGFKTFAWTAAIGAVAGIVLATSGFGFLAGTGMLWQALAGGIGGAAFGSVVGLGTGLVGGGIGAVTGGSRAASRMREEKGAANMMDAQLSAYQAQAMASQQATTIYAPTAANNNYPTASTMNLAGTTMQGGTGLDMGTINGHAVAAAR